MDNLTEDEKVVHDLATQHMKEQGQEFRPIFMTSHGLGEPSIYFVIGDVRYPDCGESHTRTHLVYMRVFGGFVLMPEVSMKIVDTSTQEVPDFREIIRRLMKLTDWPESSNLP